MPLKHFEREVCGIPLWLLQEYLLEMGGQAQGSGKVQGDGWTAQLVQLEDFCVGSLSVGQLRITVEGTADGMRKLLPELEKKLLRAGG